jgi:hypothetical protein
MPRVPSLTVPIRHGTTRAGHPRPITRHATRTRALAGVVIAVLATLIAVVAPTPPAVAAAQSSSPWEPFQGVGFNNCANEYYIFSGEHLTDVRLTQDASGGQHVSTQERLRGTAVGADSGARYVTSEGGHFSENYVSSGAVALTIPFFGNLIALHKNVPDTHYGFVFHLTIDANGNVRSYIDTFSINCP